MSISCAISKTLVASPLSNPFCFTACSTCCPILAKEICFGAWNLVLTFDAGTCSCAGILLGFTLLCSGAADGFAADGFAVGAADGFAVGAADGFAVGAAAGFGGGCLPFILILFSDGPFDSGDNSLMPGGVVELLRARGRMGGGGGVGTVMTSIDFFGALLARAFSGGGIGGPLLLARAFAAAGGFRGSLLLDLAFCGPSGGLIAAGRGSLLLDLAFSLLASEAGRFVSIFTASGVGSIFGVGFLGADVALFLRSTAA